MNSSCYVAEVCATGTSSATLLLQLAGLVHMSSGVVSECFPASEFAAAAAAAATTGTAGAIGRATCALLL
jgi:hypothetical protein